MLAESLQYLKRGSSGDYVRVIQKVLNHYPTTGSVPLATDGIFGPRTEAAVKRFQGRYSLSCDGIVGPLTRAKIFPVGTHQSLCCVTKPYEEAAPRARLGLNFLVSGDLLGQVASPAIPSLSSTTFSLAPMPSGSDILTDDIPGLPEPFPFPGLLPKLPALRFPTFPSLPPLTLPSFFPKKLQLIGSVQRAVPKLTLFGPSPKTNPVVDTFVFTVRGVWPIASGGQFQAGASMGLPISQPISDPKNTTFQVFAQGVSPDLLVDYKSWVHLYLLGKASVTVAKDGSTTSVGISPQFKASFDLSKDGSVSFGVVGGPQVSGAASRGQFTLSLTPFVTTAGITVSTP